MLMLGLCMGILEKLGLGMRSENDGWGYKDKS
jgi:hypothetical protein